MSRGVSIPPARRVGYRLFGAAFDYLLHLRPAEWPIMAAHTALGYGLAVGLDGVQQRERLVPAATGLLLWVVCLNGGTLAVNSAFDRDEADIAYLRSPPPPPRGLFGFGVALMALGQLGAIRLDGGFATAYAACFLMSLLYSVPPVRLKAVAGADWLINIIGFGALTPTAGWLATGLTLRGPELLALLAFAPLFGGLYPLTQLYELDEDRRRGDRTFAVRLGLRPSLAVALGAVLAAFGVFAVAAWMTGWGEGGRRGWALLATALACWLGLLLPWYFRAESFEPADHQRGMYLALGAWAVTDLAVAFAWM